MTKLVRTWVEWVPEKDRAGFEVDRYAALGADERGGEYTLIHRFDRRVDAEALVARVEAAGRKIDDALWVYRAPYGTQAWLDQEGGMVDQWQEHCDYEANAPYDYVREAYGATALGLED